MNKKMIVFFLALIMIVSACKNNVQPDGAGKTVEKVQDTVKEPVTTTTQTPVNTEAENKGDDAVKSFFSKITGSLEYKITYDFSMAAKGLTSAGTQVMSLKGKNVKMDVNMKGVTATTYFLDGKAYSCSDVQGNTMCFELPMAQTENTAKKNSDVTANWQDYNMVPKGTRTIAGKLATCFGYVKSDVTGEYCFSVEGAPLYVKLETNATTTEMTATEYSTSVSDSEFVLPAVPQKMPGY